jgi:hypothetical protein
MVTLIFGILWLIKGEVKIRRTPFWDERLIEASNGRLLGGIMVAGSLLPVCVPLSSNASVIMSLILVVFVITLGVAMSESVTP